MMTQPVDQTTEERARALLDQLPILYTVSQYGSVQACKIAEDHDVALIASALADERRRGMEEAAALIDKRLTHYHTTKGVNAFTRAIQINEAEGCAEAIRAKAQEEG